jgi:uncharacterized membrane protein
MEKTPIFVSQRIVQICLFVVAVIALMGGATQLLLGQPDTTPRLDNIHRFMAGVYFSCGVISGWAAITIRKQQALVFLIALAVLMGGIGRLVSISQVGIPEPTSVWMGYLIPELTIPIIIVAAHRTTQKSSKRA